MNKDNTYSGGGHPHTFVEMYGGKLIPMQSHEPDVTSFRHDYYYNSSNNILYTKLSEWINVAKEYDEEDSDYVYYSGRSVKKMVNIPDPKNFGDLYYYNLSKNKLYGKVLKWVRCTNL